MNTLKIIKHVLPVNTLKTDKYVYPDDGILNKNEAKYVRGKAAKAKSIKTK